MAQFEIYVIGEKAGVVLGMAWKFPQSIVWTYHIKKQTFHIEQGLCDADSLKTLVEAELEMDIPEYSREREVKAAMIDNDFEDMWGRSTWN